MVGLATLASHLLFAFVRRSLLDSCVRLLVSFENVLVKAFKEHLTCTPKTWVIEYTQSPLGSISIPVLVTN